MNKVSTLHFTYWLLEQRNRPDVLALSDKWVKAKDKFYHINKLHEEFMEKYPEGVLYGWSDNSINNFVNAL